MMPIKDGIETIKEIRKTKAIPVIMLSAKSEDEDKIKGLNIGADDYVTKPFNPLELIARVNSGIRRFTKLRNNNKRRKRKKIQLWRPNNRRQPKKSNS